MSLTPKNWAQFQHYKNRRPAWIKLHHALLDDYGFVCLPDASRALAPCIWLLASEYQDGCITASLAEIAFRVHLSESELKSALIPLIENGFIIDASNMLADCYQLAIPEKRKSRVREESIGAVFPQKAVQIKDHKFNEFKLVYPKRDGANPWKPAEKVWIAAIKAGADPDAIIAGAKRYASAPSTKVGTPYVTQAKTWLQQQRWTDYAPTTEQTWIEQENAKALLKYQQRREINDKEQEPHTVDGCGDESTDNVKKLFPTR